MVMDVGAIKVTNFSAGIDQLWRLPRCARFRSPQLCRGEPLTMKDDVYALGVLMLELSAAGSPIFRDLDEEAMQKHILASNLPAIRPDSALHAAAAAALSPEPSARPGYQQLVQLLPSSRVESVTMVPNLHVLERRHKRLATGLIQAQVVTPHRRLKQQALMAIYADQAGSLDLWVAWQRSASKMTRLYHPRLLPILATASLGHPRASEALVVGDVPCILDMQQSLSAWQARKYVTVDVLAALEYLLARRLVPVNLSLANIYLHNGHAKLFGLVLSSDEADLEAVTSVYVQLLRDGVEHLSVLCADKPLQRFLGNASTPQAQSEVGKSATALSLLAIQAADICASNAKWHLPWNALTLVKFLGQGGFGRVSLMTIAADFESPNLRLLTGDVGDVGDGRQYVAVKELLEANCAAEFQQELSIMTKIRHPHLVTLLHHVDEPGHQALVLEYLDGGSLDDWLQTPLGIAASEPVLFSIVQSIAAGMAELARLNIVHRDLAARNVLVSADGSIVKVRVAHVHRLSCSNVLTRSLTMVSAAA